MSTKDKDVTSFRFFDLPYEIRRMIYIEVLQQPVMLKAPQTPPRQQAPQRKDKRENGVTKAEPPRPGRIDTHEHVLVLKWLLRVSIDCGQITYREYCNIRKRSSRAPKIDWVPNAWHKRHLCMRCWWWGQVHRPPERSTCQDCIQQRGGIVRRKTSNILGRVRRWIFSPLPGIGNGSISMMLYHRRFVPDCIGDWSYSFRNIYSADEWCKTCLRNRFSLLFTSKAVFEEAIPIFFDVNHFTAWSPSLTASLRRFPTTEHGTVSCVRNLLFQPVDSPACVCCGSAWDNLVGDLSIPGDAPQLSRLAHLCLSFPNGCDQPSIVARNDFAIYPIADEADFAAQAERIRMLARVLNASDIRRASVQIEGLSTPGLTQWLERGMATGAWSQDFHVEEALRDHFYNCQPRSPICLYHSLGA